jgi:hypothetical protein
MLEPMLIAAYAVAGLTFFGTLLLTLNRDKVNSVRGRTQSRNEELKRDSPDLIEADNHRLTDSVLVIKELVSNCVIALRESWLEFSFEVFNISGDTLRIGHEVDGTIIFQGNRLHKKPVPSIPQDIHGGSRATVTIKQPLTWTEAAIIEVGSRKVDGVSITFDFRDLRVSVEEAAASPEKWPKGMLALKKRRTYRVRQNSRLRELYLWERIDEEREGFRSVSGKGPQRLK